MRYKIITYILFLLFALGLIGAASIVSAQRRGLAAPIQHMWYAL